MRIVATIMLIGLVAGCAPFQRQQTEAQPTPIELVGGGYATPQTVAQDDLADILNISRWAFTLELPPSRAVNYVVEVVQPGQEPAQLLTLSQGARPDNTEQTDVLAALQPLDGSSATAERLRVFLRAGGGTSSTIVDNPFAELNSFAPAAAGQQLDDGSLLLYVGHSSNQMTTDRDGIVVTDDMTLITLRIVVE